MPINKNTTTKTNAKIKTTTKKIEKPKKITTQKPDIFFEEEKIQKIPQAMPNIENLDTKKHYSFSHWLVWFFVFIIPIFVLAYIFVNSKSINKIYNNLNSCEKNTESGANNLSDIKQFTSADDFKDYLSKAPKSDESSYVQLTGVTSRDSGVAMEKSVATDDIAPTNMATPSVAGNGVSSERFSQTNTQVLNIDEADSVKTDGKNIYLSSNQPYLLKRGFVGEIMPTQMPTSNTKIIKAFPVEDLRLESKIEKSGDMFVDKNVLVIFEGQNIYGYDIGDTKSPKQKWSMKLDNGSYVVSSRMANGDIYLVVAKSINEFDPCPIKPLSVGENTVSIDCSEIYHPVNPVAIDTTFIALKINTQSGNVENKISFVGSNAGSVVYMSSSALYITYNYDIDSVKFFYNFIKNNATDLFPSSVTSKISSLINYDISQSAKSVELGNILSKYYMSLGDDERLKVQSEFTNRMSDYYKSNMRDLEKTGIAKIDINKFNIVSNGSVSGKLLNQFSLDEYNGNLRVATTIGENRWYSFGSVNGESVNDVYVLDKNLNLLGSVKDLGQSERIYSVRFIENMGYVVTFRQTDPFYVLDLKNPKNPELKGQLKIPGYSSYLHPIAENIILGVGQENNGVKLSLFDVNDPSNPKEIDKYNLDEYWTEIMSNHHAFLLDKEHNAFFVPGGKGAYIFGYKDNKLSLERAVSENSIKRAVYINNYLYVIGDDKVVAIDESNWKDVKELDLE